MVDDPRKVIPAPLLRRAAEFEKAWATERREDLRRLAAQGWPLHCIVPATDYFRDLAEQEARE